MNRLSLLCLAVAACATPSQDPVRDREGPVTAALSQPDGQAPATQAVTLSAASGALVLDLTRNDHLFAPGYTATVVDPGGAVRTLPLAETPAANPCFYLGTVRDSAGTALGRAAVSTCLGSVRGLVEVEGGLYALDATEAGGRLTRVERTLPDDLRNTAGATLTLPTLGDLSQRPPPSTRTVELHTWSDETVFAARGAAGALADDAERANIAQLAYADSAFSGPVLVTLVAQSVLSDNPFPFTPVGSEIDTGDLLSDFLNFADGQPTPADAWSLTSNADFAGSTVGLAPVGAICSSSSGFVIQAFSTVAVEGITLAHELGHVLGMFHDGDGNPCPTSGFVMSPFIDPFSPASTFSSCSTTYFESLDAMPGVDCLDDAGDPPVGASCGDGVVSGTEACDCGPFDCAVVDPCCDAATCQLAAGATCSAADGCCDPATCDAATAGTTCRGAADADCDAAETCDGVSTTCPADAFVPAGTTCDSDGFDGACYLGDCVSTGAQCEALQSTFAGDFTSSATCDVFNDACGDLVCAFSPSDPGFCVVFTTGSGDLQVQDGTSCGLGEQCVDGACVDSDTLNPTVDNCPADPAKTEPGLCGCGVPDTDGDGDGTPNCLDTCPADPAKSAPGACGCGFSDGDSDGDGAADCFDACPTDPAKVTTGICGCGNEDIDVDPGPAFVCPGCGNDILEGSEDCDDGGTADGDGCSRTCEVEALTLFAPIPGVAGVSNTWQLTGTRPGATITLLAALRAGISPVPLCPGLSVPLRRAEIVGTVVGGDDGRATFTLTPPTTIAGRDVHFAAVDQSLCEASPAFIERM